MIVAEAQVILTWEPRQMCSLTLLPKPPRIVAYGPNRHQKNLQPPNSTGAVTVVVQSWPIFQTITRLDRSHSLVPARPRLFQPNEWCSGNDSVVFLARRRIESFGRPRFFCQTRIIHWQYLVSLQLPLGDVLWLQECPAQCARIGRTRFGSRLDIGWATNV